MAMKSNIAQKYHYAKLYCTGRNQRESSGVMYRPRPIYRKTSNLKHTLVANKIVDHLDAVGASPVGAAPTKPSLSISYLASQD